MRKRLITWVITIPMVLSLSAFTNVTTKVAKPGDPYGKYDKTVTLNVGRGVDPSEKLPSGDTPENNQYTRYIKSNLNIETKDMWEAASGNDYIQKVNLSIASNNLPDAMIVNATQFRQMANAGEIQDLTSVYNDYASPAVKAMMASSKGIALKSVTIGGKIMAIPSLTVPEDGYHLMWIRKDWLDKLGLKVPKTLKDVEKVAKAFMDKDPGNNGKGNTIGIVGPQNGGSLYADFISPTNNAFGLDPVFSSFHSYPGYWVKDSKGKAAYGSILPQTKKALAEIRNMYASKILDPQMSVRKDATEPIVSGKAGIFFGPWWMGYWPLPDAWKNNPNANWQAYAVPLDASGVWAPHMSTPAIQFCVVRKGYAYPEAAMKIINLNNRDESKFDLSKGGTGNEVLRIVMSAYNECPVSIKYLKQILAGTKKPEAFAAPEYAVYKLLKGDAADIKAVKTKPVDKFDIQYWNPSANPSGFYRLYSLMVGVSPIYEPKLLKNQVFSLVYSQTPSMATMWSNLRKLEDQTFLKIIMGAAPLDSFDKFVKDWKAQGGDKITAEVETEYKK